MARFRSHSSVPLVAGFLAAASFVLAAIAYEVGAYPSADANDVASVAMLDTPAALSATDPVDQLSSPNRQTRPVIAIVIDDAGVDYDQTMRAIELGIPLTVSFLPYGRHTNDLSTAAERLGHDIFLHMPMEPVGLDDPGPGAITRFMEPEQITYRMRHALAQVPGATGLNNHMGSAVTSDAAIMQVALRALENEGLVFIDSLTSGRSRAGSVARSLGYTTLSRDIFLDHDPNGLEHQLAELEVLARSTGFALAIGHPRAGTLEALEQWLAEGRADAFSFVTVSEFVRLQQQAVIRSASNETVRLFSGAE